VLYKKEEAMKKSFLFVVLVTLVSAQVTITRITISRKTESILTTLFEKLPERIEVFITSDSTYIIEATYKNQKMIQELTATEYRDLLAKKPPKLVILKNARVPYLLGQTSLGLFLYSWSLPVALELEDKNAAVVGLFTPLVYASIQYAWAKGRGISGGTAVGALMGGLEGVAHGALLFKSEKAIFPFSLSENIVDNVLGQTMGFTPGMHQRKFNHCFYGYYHYAALKTLVSDWDVWDDVEDIARIGTVLSLGEGYTSLLLSRSAEYLTYGDALFELRTAVMGAEIVPLILATFDLHREEQSDERIYAATSLVGHGLGYVLGQKLARRYNLSGAAGTMMWILPYLAHGATAGLVVLTESEGLAKSYPAIFLTMDLALTYFSYKVFAEKATEIGKVDVPNFNITVNPLCFVLKDKDARGIPFLTVSYKF
jgi:hypothetical protein